MYCFCTVFCTVCILQYQCRKTKTRLVCPAAKAVWRCNGRQLTLLPGLSTESVVWALLFSRLFKALRLPGGPPVSARRPDHRVTGPRSWTCKIGLNKLTWSKLLVETSYSRYC